MQLSRSTKWLYNAYCRRPLDLMGYSKGFSSFFHTYFVLRNFCVTNTALHQTNLWYEFTTGTEDYKFDSYLQSYIQCRVLVDD